MRIEFPTVREVPSEQIGDSRSSISVDALGNISLDSLEVPEGLLESYLRAQLKENPGRKLQLDADRRVPLERLIEVWDALTKVGIPIKDVPARIKVQADAAE